MQISDKEWLELLQALQALEKRVRLIEEAISSGATYGLAREFIQTRYMPDHYQLNNITETLMTKPRYSLKDKA